MFILFYSIPLEFSLAISNITQSESLAQGQTLISPSLKFELGFFSPYDKPKKQYVGIWYKGISPLAVVWVANRENPLAATDTSATLNIARNGNLELLDGKFNSIWSTNAVVPSNSSSLAILLDNGNLVLRDGISGENIWESFKHPGNTFLPGSVLGFNVKTGENLVLTSWKSGSNPSLGNFSYKVSQQAPPQVFILINGSTPYWRSGPWDKSKFVGSPDMDSSYSSDCHLVEDLDMGTTYLHFVDRYNGSAVLKVSISSHGVLTSEVKHSGSNVWETKWKRPENECGVYGVCGPFGVCKISESPICKCLKGFEPKSYDEWSKGNWTGGCVRRTKLLCLQNVTSSSSQGGKTDGFVKMGMTKLPDFYEYLDVKGVDNCLIWCLENCSCLAYAYVNGIGCLVWSTKSPLLDIQEFSYGGQDLFLRLANAELDGQISKNKIIGLATISSSAILFGIVLLVCFCRWRANHNVNKSKETAKHLISWIKSRDNPGNVLQFSTQMHEPQLPFYDFGSILAATNNFSISNKLGEGGFGPVYKGKIPGGREIAVKRLSSSSRQGIEEFKNETILISKLQHRNLVRLVGCCIENEEKLLIYEFMPNKSLDTFIFDARKREQLKWDTRYNIIHCVARGLVYLHRDSFLRIIHRDLKVSNILLDEDMNPKISDFGLARIFHESLDQANTHRIVGTLGYMSPEYAMSGLFSEKSDVFSFGILILEIISGRKNTSFYHEELHRSLVAYAWKLWSEGRAMELVDEAILGDLCNSSEVTRCIHVGLLCVQDHAKDRPTMPDVVLMLSNEAHCPDPNQSVLTVESSPMQQLPSTCSVDEATISYVDGR
uniref:Receptor-like serine/threonine-protein kinase n=1 Tax=Cannabis sativa TaxID=3483 RepID=A0A803NZE1_CANSA